MLKDGVGLFILLSWQKDLSTGDKREEFHSASWGGSVLSLPFWRAVWCRPILGSSWWPQSLYQGWEQPAEGGGGISLKEEPQSSTSSALLSWGDEPSGWPPSVSPEHMLRHRIMAYKLSLFNLGIGLLSRPGFSLPKGTVSWNHRWCPQWHQLKPVPQASGLPHLRKTSIWRDVTDSSSRNFWCPKGKLYEYFHEHTCSPGLFDANNVDLVLCIQVQLYLPFFS